MTIRLDRFWATYGPLGSWQLWVMCGVGILVATAGGPFGTFTGLSLGLRFAYWLTVVVSSLLLGYTGYAIVRSVVDPANQLRTILWGSIVGTVLISVAVWTCNNIAAMFGSFEVTTFGLVLSYVALVNAAVGVQRFLMLHPAPQAEEQPQVVPASPELVQPRLVRRLPAGMQGDILHLSVNDHFVEVFTEAGSTNIRMRFRDALDELDGLNGYQVHRSHWVAHAAVQGIEKDRTRVFLNLPQGRRVPVSRNYRPTLEEAGWL